MAQLPYSTNPGSAVPGLPSASLSLPQATNVPTLKPGGNMDLTKPMPIANRGQVPQLQQDAQARTPGIPNNGNPNGAHNNGQVRIPGVRNSRFGGGFIGTRPAGSTVGAGGYSYGQGALTQNQQAQNEQRTQAYNQQQASQAAPQAGMGNFQQMLQNMMRQYSGAQPVPQLQQSNSPFTNPSGSFNNGMGPQQAPNQGYPQMQQPQQPPQQMDPVYRGGQDPRLGRYQPPQVGPGGQWSNQGGYSYNLPNTSGPYPQYGQGQYGYGNPNYNPQPTAPGLPLGY